MEDNRRMKTRLAIIIIIIIAIVIIMKTTRPMRVVAFGRAAQGDLGQ
jgi:hypothetical protein